MAAAFDAESRQVGSAIPILDQMAQDSGSRTPQVMVSRTGTLAYLPLLSSGTAPTLAWVDPDGVLEPLGELPIGASTVSLSPDGRFAIVGMRSQPREVFLWDMARGVATGVAVEGNNPRWHPDGRRIGLGGALRFVNVDDGVETTLPEDSRIDSSPSWAADGETLAYTVREPTRDIAALLPGGSAMAKQQGGPLSDRCRLPGAVRGRRRSLSTLHLMRLASARHRQPASG